MAIEMKRLLPGKLDHDFLESLLDYTGADSRVVQGSQVGEDATVIDMGERLLVVKSDPITFATKDIGHYAVHVNANDIVCMGGEPKWFFVTILLPEGAEKAMVEAIFQQIAAACRRQNIVWCGGHTEVTIGLSRPIVSGHMLGETDHEHVLLKKNARIGDHILLVQAAPVEATMILANEKADILEKQFSPEFVKRCQKLFKKPGISVREYAKLAQRTAEVHAMHDPTEGGVATALHELAMAVGAGLRIEKEKIPVLAEGKLVCDFFNINPLGAIASGSLLLAAPYKSVAPLLKAFEKKNIPAEDIGKLVPEEEGIVLFEDGEKKVLPIFAQDEIARLL